MTLPKHAEPLNTSHHTTDTRTTHSSVVYRERSGTPDNLRITDRRHGGTRRRHDTQQRYHSVLHIANVSAANEHCGHGQTTYVSISSNGRKRLRADLLANDLRSRRSFSITDVAAGRPRRNAHRRRYYARGDKTRSRARLTRVPISGGPNTRALRTTYYNNNNNSTAITIRTASHGDATTRGDKNYDDRFARKITPLRAYAFTCCIIRLFDQTAERIHRATADAASVDWSSRSARRSSGSIAYARAY